MQEGHRQFRARRGAEKYSVRRELRRLQVELERVLTPKPEAPTPEDEQARAASFEYWKARFACITEAWREKNAAILGCQRQNLEEVEDSPQSIRQSVSQTIAPAAGEKKQ